MALPMQDQRSACDPAVELDELDRVVLHAAQALVSLHAAGLIHRLEDFVFATRSAMRFASLERVR
jgi:hypothetical protein